MTYKEYKDIQQKSVNDLPIFWAFGKEQFREAMEEHGLTENDTDKIYSLGGGGYYLRSDAEVIRAFFNKKDELPELMKDPAFAEDAFIAEMKNHEYWINDQGDWDVCSCFGNCEYKSWKEGPDYLEEMGYGDGVIQAFKSAKKKVWDKAIENDWF